MIERPEKKQELQEMSPEDKWASLLDEIKLGVLKEAHIFSQAHPEQKEVVVAEADSINAVVEEIGKAKLEERRRLIEICRQEQRIPEDVYRKLLQAQDEVELGALKGEVSPGVKEKITGPEAMKAVAQTVEEVVQTNPFWSKWREKIAGKIKPAEIWAKLKDKKIFGQIAPAFLTGAVMGGGVRIAVRLGLGTLTGGAGYALAISSGAVSGAILEGIKSYKKESGRKLSEAEFLQKITEKTLEGGAKEKLERYLDLISKKETAELSSEKQKLYEALKKEQKIKSVRWGQVVRGVGKGALIGLVGGVLGGYLGGLVGEYFAPGKATEMARAANEAVKAVKGVGTETLKKELEDAALGAQAKAYDKSVVAGVAALKEKTFEVSAKKGEGATHAARKLIHDFIAQNHSLGKEVGLGKGQMVYAEDDVRRMFEGGTTHLGDTFTATGEDIAEVIKKAGGLGKEAIKNLEEKFVPEISPEAWGKMTNYNILESPTNNFAGNILQQANNGAAVAANKAVQEAIQRAVEANNITAEVVKAKDEWFKDKWVEYGLYGLGAAWIGTAAGAIGLDYKLGRKNSRAQGMELRETPQINLVGPTEKPSETDLTQKVGTQETSAAPPIKEVNLRTYREIKEFEYAVKDAIWHKLGVDIFVRLDVSLNTDQAYEGAKKLQEVLLADKVLARKLHKTLIRIKDVDTEPEKMKSRFVGNYTRITMDYSKSPEEMRRFLEDATEKIGNLG